MDFNSKSAPFSKVLGRVHSAKNKATKVFELTKEHNDNSYNDSSNDSQRQRASSKLNRDKYSYTKGFKLIRNKSSVDHLDLNLKGQKNDRETNSERVGVISKLRIFQGAFWCQGFGVQEISNLW